MKNNFVAPNNVILTQIAEKVTADELDSSRIEQIIKEMLAAGYGEQKDTRKPILVGLAAPQIGIEKRIILVDVEAGGKNPPNPLSQGGVGVERLRVYVNPEIVWRSEEENEWYEGCYSTDRVCGIVSRATRVRVRALTRMGERIEEEYGGYTARIFQHEIDHLNGKVFVDHITDDDKLHWVEKDAFPKYRDNEGWRSWPWKCTREKWENIKVKGEK